jgi:hypothetical protein
MPKVAIIGDWIFTGNPHWYGMKDAFERLGWEVQQINENEECEPECDLLIIGGLSSRNKHTINYVKGKCPSVLWYRDTVNNIKWTDIEPDYICAVTDGDINEIKEHYKVPVFHVMQGAMPKKNIERINPNNNIVFIASPSGVGDYSERKRQIEYFNKDKNFILYYHNELPWIREKIHKEMDNIYTNAVVCIGGDTMRERHLAFSNRLWNVMGSGGFYLTLYTNGMEELFENKKHLVWVDTIEEQYELAKYYQSHQEETRKIAEEGFKLVQSKHTIDNRIKQILQCIKYQ